MNSNNIPVYKKNGLWFINFNAPGMPYSLPVYIENGLSHRSEWGAKYWCFEYCERFTVDVLNFGEEKREIIRYSSPNKTEREYREWIFRRNNALESARKWEASPGNRKRKYEQERKAREPGPWSYRVEGKKVSKEEFDCYNASCEES